MTTIFAPRRLIVPAMVGLCIGLSCTEVRVTSPDVASVEVLPGSTSVVVGEPVQFEARVTDTAGNTLVGRPVEWSTSAPNLVEVDGTGLARGRAPGTAEIEAISGDARGTAALTVLAPPRVALDIQAIEFTATPADGEPLFATVAISNDGDGELTGLSAATTYGEAAATGWLTTALDRDFTPAVLTLEASAEALEPGTYEATITVSADSEAAQIGSLAVTLRVTSSNPEPALSGVDPGSGRRGETLEIGLTGSGFVPELTEVSFGSGISVNSVDVRSPTSLVAGIGIAADAAIGSRSVSVSNPAPGGGTAELEDGFAVLELNPAPELTAADPQSGARGETLDVLLTGAGFVQGLSAVSFGAGLTVNSVTVSSPTTIVANVTIGADAALGARDVSVTNPAPGGGTATLEGGFAVVQGNPAPTLTDLAPQTGQREQTLNVTLTGSGFVAELTQVDFGSLILINSVTVSDATSLVANITIGSAAALGARDVSVTNPAPGGGTATLNGAFTVEGLNPAPSLTSVSPSSGQRGSTLDVTLTGDDFVDGLTASFGSGISVNNLAVSSSTSLTASITIAGSASIGARDVSVTNPAPGGGTATLSDGFTVLQNNPAPGLSAVDPSSGAPGETLNVTLSGSGFVADLTTVSFGTGIGVNNVAVSSSTSLVANVTVDPGAPLGARDVSVTNPAPGGGTATLEGGFAVVQGNPAPTLTDLAPQTGQREQTLNVTLTGSGFVAELTQVDFGSLILINSVTINTATSLVANITIGSAAALGARDVSVTNPAPGGGTATLTGAFTVEGANPAPSLTSVSPSSGQRGSTLDVTLTGDNFVDGLTASFGSGISVNDLAVGSSTSLTASITIAGSANLGARDVSVTNPAPGGGTATLSDGFTVLEDNPAPGLSAVDPSSGVQGETLDVTLTGSGFVADLTTASFGSGISVNDVAVSSSTSLTANITIAGSASPGLRNVSATNPAPGGGTATLSNGFTVLENNPAPGLSAVDPSSGQRGSTLDVTLTGSGFVADLTTASFGSGISVNDLDVSSSTSLTANITIASSASPGARDVSVTNPAPGGGTATLSNGFTVFQNNPAPGLSAVDPSSAAAGETLDVTLTGSGFVADLTTVSFGSGISVNDVDVSSSTSLVANVTVDPGAAPGARDVSVTNPAPGGGTATLSDGFTVLENNPAPGLSAVDPSSGSPGETLDVTLTGSGYVADLTTVSFGSGISVNDVAVSSATSLVANVTVDPGAAPGARDVSVTNPAPGGGTATLEEGFTVLEANPVPVLTAVTPSSGTQGTTMVVTLTGERFAADMSADFWQRIAVNSVEVTSATSATVSITIFFNAQTGPRRVIVTNPPPGGGADTLVAGFTVLEPTAGVTEPGAEESAGVSGNGVGGMMAGANSYRSGSAGTGELTRGRRVIVRYPAVVIAGRNRPAPGGGKSWAQSSGTRWWHE